MMIKPHNQSEESPCKLGFRMPAEWEPHEATWISWPHNAETWPGKHGSIFPVWVEMIRSLVTSEKVHINVNNSQMEEGARRVLIESGVSLEGIAFHHFPTNDCWIRDNGPTFVVSPSPRPSPQEGEGVQKELVIIDWSFNAWGKKYPPWDQDNAIPRKISDKFGIKRFEPGIVLEGGSIDVNGEGALITTEQCLLNKNRNPHLKKGEIEDYLKNYLGVDHILWLGDGIAGDDTDGHVDNVARFVNSNTVVAAVEENSNDENYKPLLDNLKKIEKIKNQEGDSLNIVTLPMPRPVVHKGRRLPASYANFYIANKVVLVPTFRHPNDEKVMGILQTCFPERKIVGIDAADLVWGFGAFHCITQQQPKVLFS